MLQATQREIEELDERVSQQEQDVVGVQARFACTSSLLVRGRHGQYGTRKKCGRSRAAPSSSNTPPIAARSICEFVARGGTIAGRTRGAAAGQGGGRGLGSHTFGKGSRDNGFAMSTSSFQHAKNMLLMIIKRTALLFTVSAVILGRGGGAHDAGGADA